MNWMLIIMINLFLVGRADKIYASNFYLDHSKKLLKKELELANNLIKNKFLTLLVAEKKYSEANLASIRKEQEVFQKDITEFNSILSRLDNLYEVSDVKNLELMVKGGVKLDVYHISLNSSLSNIQALIDRVQKLDRAQNEMCQDNISNLDVKNINSSPNILTAPGIVKHKEYSTILGSGDNAEGTNFFAADPWVEARLFSGRGFGNWRSCLCIGDWG